MPNAVSAVAMDQESSLHHSPSSAQLELVAVTILALVIRLAWVWFGAWASGDSAWYINVSRNIAFHHAFSASADGRTLVPTAFRPPLYSAIIAALWIGNSPPVFAVLLLQAVLGAAAVALCYLIARDQFGHGVAMLAAVGLALAPMTGYFTAVILSETLFTFLLTLGVFCWGRERYVAAGIAFGLGSLTRVTLLPFVVLLPWLTLLRPWRSYRRGYLTISLLSLTIASVWVARNAIEFHRFIPIAASGYGTNLLVGSMATSEADDVPKRRAVLGSVDAAGGKASVDETEFDRVRLRAGLRRIGESPGRWLIARVQQYPRLFIDNGSYMFGSEGVPFRVVIREGRIVQVFVRITFILSNALVFSFALLGIIGERERFARLSHLTLFPIFLAAVSLPLWIEPRYGLPMMPLVAVLSATGFTRSLKLWRHS